MAGVFRLSLVLLTAVAGLCNCGCGGSEFEGTSTSPIRPVAAPLAVDVDRAKPAAESPNDAARTAASTGPGPGPVAGLRNFGPPSPRPQPPPKPASAEKTAGALLGVAEDFLDSDDPLDRKKGKAFLETLLKQFPGTKAAGRAGELLEGLK